MAKWEFFKGHRENWFSWDVYNWVDMSDPDSYTDYPDLMDRCSPDRVRRALSAWTDYMVMDVRYYPAGSYKEPGKPLLTNVPAFCLVRLKEFISGRHVANIKLFLPQRWNRRFMGIAGAGSNLETDWDKEQTTNITSWPMAVRNGFACVVNDGATGMFVDASWGFYGGDLEWDMIENWAFYGTHQVTMMAKAVVEAVYGDRIYKSYMHGTSGGARQIMAEAQRFPEDYDGLWADGPLYDYYNMMFSCLWAALIFYNEPHRVPLSKFQAAKKLARKWQDANKVTTAFDPSESDWLDFLAQLMEISTPDGRISKEDLQVMIKVWNGPLLSDGTRITYGFGPEITQWPVGPRQFGYLRIKENGHPSLIPFALQQMRWIRRDPNWDFTTCTYEEFEKMYLEHKDEFARYACYDPDLRKMAAYNKKLILTHGTGDHIVPNQMSLEYYKKACGYFRSEAEMKRNFRAFFPRYGGHALYDWDGPNVTNASGLSALMRWVEQEIPPEELTAMNYDFLEERLVKESSVPVYTLHESEYGTPWFQR
ncbi:MAG: tannase/feruloyl esterase family alpha/beta hydrolase [Eubacterium sp.]|nr:tannase/feruloyl esterase family alpha/beta hydrolase [Eubacterium sp.]